MAHAEHYRKFRIITEIKNDAEEVDSDADVPENGGNFPSQWKEVTMRKELIIKSKQKNPKEEKAKLQQTEIVSLDACCFNVDMKTR